MRWRTPVGIIYQIPFNLGHLTLAPIGYFLRDWRHQQLVISIPSLLLISYYCLLPESPRWLLTMKKEEEAVEMMERTARRNGLPTDHIKSDVKHYLENKANVTQAQAGNMTDLFRTRNIRRNWFCISFNWVVCGLCFFGVAQYMGRIAGNVFVNIAFSAIVQIPGTFLSIWAVKKLGRRMTLIMADLLSGLSFLAIAFVPKEPTWIVTTLGTLSMFGLSICFPTVYIYAGELFPTIIRNVGVGSSSMCARIGSMLAPLVANLSHVAPVVPPIIFCIIPLIGAALCWQLPETVGVVLPDTIEEAEQFKRHVTLVKEPKRNKEDRVAN